MTEILLFQCLTMFKILSQTRVENSGNVLQSLKTIYKIAMQHKSLVKWNDLCPILKTADLVNVLRCFHITKTNWSMWHFLTEKCLSENNMLFWQSLLAKQKTAVAHS